MDWKVFGVLGIVAVIVIAGGMLFFSSQSPSATGLVFAKPFKMTFAEIPAVFLAPVYVAKEKGFWEKRGLDVELVNVGNSGGEQFNVLLAGKVDAIIPADLPVALYALKGKDFYVVSTLYKARYQAVARKSAGISTPVDLAGKTVAVKSATGPQYVFYKMLEAYNISPSTVNQKSIDVSLMPLALAKKDVDAIFAWPPFDNIAENALREDAVVFDSPVVTLDLLVFRKDYVQAHPAEVEKFVEGLAEADEFIAEHPAAAKAIAAKRSGLNASVVDSIWPRASFTVDLDDSEIQAMDDITAWVVQSGLSEGDTPDYCEIFYLAAVQNVGFGKDLRACSNR